MGSSGNVEWSALVAFAIALGVLSVAALIGLRQSRLKLNTPLPHLESSWSFGESWATNVTLAASILTGVFGSSEVVTSLGGESGKGPAALATVGAAVAASFVAAGSLIVLSSKTKDEHLSVGGLVAAAAVTLAGGFGEIWVLFRAGEKLDLGGWQDAAGVMAGAAALLLGWYAIRSVKALIQNGLETPAAASSYALAGANILLDAAKATPAIDTAQVQAALTAAEQLHPELAAASLPSKHARKAALL